MAPGRSSNRKLGRHRAMRPDYPYRHSVRRESAHYFDALVSGEKRRDATPMPLQPALIAHMPAVSSISTLECSRSSGLTNQQAT